MENQDLKEHILLGEFLKQKRIENNFSIEKLSQKSKISVNILKALELNDFKNLPSPAYIKGFVLTYVKIIGIPKEEAISKLEYTYFKIVGKPFPALDHTKLMSATNTQVNYREESDEESAPQKIIESGESILKNTKSLLPVIIFAGVILVFVGGYKIISSVIESEVNSNKTKDLGPKIESSSALVNKPEEKAPETKPEAVTPATTEETPAPAAAAVPIPEEVKPEPEIRRNFPPVEFRPIRGKLFTIQPDAPENQDESLLPRSIRDSMNSNLQNVYIKAVDGNTWLSYKLDNQPIESVIINQGKDLFLQGSEIRIFFGNVNVTKIFYNNYLVNAATKSGVKSLIFPEESNSKYQLPLFPKASDDILHTSEDYQKRMKLEEEELKKRN